MTNEQEPINEHESTETSRSRQIIAEGINSTQLRTVLGALAHKQLINCIGTPSREEVIRLEGSGDPGALRALGGFIMSGMEDLYVDTIVEFVSIKNPSQRFDLSILTVPMAENDLGISAAVVAQVYLTDPNTPPVADTDIQKWLNLNNLEVRKRSHQT